MGDDFAGIVYLHGSLRQESRHLIVTDKDFGRAYLRDAWAARFLERMFASFTVLFVGYSHDDVVMRYLARSLGRQSGRYVLTSDTDASKWRPLGIEPIPYEVRASSHAALARAISGWARLLSMGLLDHRQQIARLVAAPPSSIPEEESYLSSVIADEQLVSLFTELARDEAWLRWAAEQPDCRSIFDPAGLDGTCRPRVLLPSASTRRCRTWARIPAPWRPNVVRTLERRRAALHRWLAATGVGWTRVVALLECAPTGATGSTTPR
jgi:hypothetical protein